VPNGPLVAGQQAPMTNAASGSAAGFRLARGVDGIEHDLEPVGNRKADDSRRAPPGDTEASTATQC
jgi:hypothetical protein